MSPTGWSFQLEMLLPLGLEPGRALLPLLSLLPLPTSLAGPSSSCQERAWCVSTAGASLFGAFLIHFPF